MKLYIDMIAFYLQKAGGITSVWKELLIRMLRDGQDIVLILQKSKCESIYFDQIMSYKPDVIYDKEGDININRYLPVRCHLEDNNKYISTYYRTIDNNTMRQFVLVHDFTYEYYINGIRRLVHSLQKQIAVRKSEVIFCVSNNTKYDLIKFYPWAMKKNIYVIYNGVNESYSKVYDNKDVEELGIYNQVPFLLYVGSRAKYKRFDFAIEVAEKYGFALVIIGGGELQDKEINSLGVKLNNYYLHLKGITDETLNLIYNKAFALIYPSEYEGFGIPIIEAQKAGCPIIAYNGSSISEVVSNKEILMNEISITEADKIIKKLNDKVERNKIIELGYSNSERFEWEKIYMRYVEILC